MKRYDAIVLGGGPAGSSAAFFLAEAGFRVAVVEKAEFPRRKVCGEFVSATTFPVLDAMGVGAEIRAQGGPPTRRVGFDAGERRVAAPMPRLQSGEGWGRTLARAVLDPTLLRAAHERGADVYQPWKAVGMERRADEWEIDLTNEGDHERLAAPLVVAAHGSWEVGSLPTQPPKRHGPSDVLAFKAFFHGASFPDDLMSLVAFPGGYGGIVHRDAETVGLSFCVRRDVLERCRAQQGGATAWESLVRYVAAHCRSVRESFAEATLECPPKAAGPLRPGVRILYADGVFRVGNAAGEAHPTIAEGISMAVQSGCLLAKHVASLREGRSLDEVGAAYARAWRAQFLARIRMADVYARLCMGPNLGRLTAATLQTLPPLLTLGADLSGKTKALPQVPRSLNKEFEGITQSVS